MRPHTRAEAEAVVDAVDELAGHLPRRPRPPAGVRRRRVLPAGRPAVPGRRRLRGLPDARGRHRHGPHVRARVRRRGRRADRACRAASSPGSTARRPRATAPRDPAGDTAWRASTPSLDPPPAAAARRPSSPATYGARVLRAAAGRASGAPTSASSRSRNEFFGGNTAVTGLMVGADLARVLADEPPGHRYLLPDVCLSEGRFLDGTTPADLPRPVEIVATDGIALRGGPGDERRCPWSPSSGGPTSARARSSTASSASRSRSSRTAPASPATARRSRPSGSACRSCSSTPAAGCPGGTDLEEKVSRQVEKAVRGADVVLFVVDAARRRHRGGRRRRRLAAAHAASPCCCVANKADNDRRERETWEFLVARRSASRTRSARCTAAAPATCSTRCSAAACRKRRADDGDGDGDGDERRCRAWPGVPGVAIVGRPERRQVHAVQPADRRGPLRRPRHARHHPRRRRHRRRHARRARSASSTPPACGARARSTTAPEYYSLVRALRAVDDADVALLVIDATEGVTSQDQRLAERDRRRRLPGRRAAQQVGAARDAERPRRRHRPDLARRLHFIGDAPVLKISAADRQGRAQAAAGAGRRHRALPPPGADPRASTR